MSERIWASVLSEGSLVKIGWVGGNAYVQHNYDDVVLRPGTTYALWIRDRNVCLTDDKNEPDTEKTCLTCVHTKKNRTLAPCRKCWLSGAHTTTTRWEPDTDQTRELEALRAENKVFYDVLRVLIGTEGIDRHLEAEGLTRRERE